MVKKVFFLFWACFLAVATAQAQDPRAGYPPQAPQKEREAAPTPKKPDTKWGQIKEHLVPGGNFGFSMSGSFMQLELSPLLGYRITDNWLAGIGGSYMMFRETYQLQNPTTGVRTPYTAVVNIFGPRVWTQHTLFNNIFAHAEYEGLNVPVFPNGFYVEDASRQWIGNPMVGPGLRQQMGRRSFFNMMALYNLNHFNNVALSPYRFPIVIRFGVMF